MKSETISMKVSQQEKKRITETAKNQGVVMSEFMRRAIIKECELCKPKEEGLSILVESNDKVKIGVSLDRAVLDAIDKHVNEIGTTRNYYIQKILSEKKAIYCNISLDLSESYNELINEMAVLNKGNSNILKMLTVSDGVFTDYDREIVKDNSKKVADAIADMLKQIWKLNIVVKDIAKKEVSNYLKENGG